MRHSGYLLICVGCLLALFSPAARADLLFGATLLPGNEVPPHSTAAFGVITVDLHDDLNTLEVIETFSSLSAAAAAAHIHCCAGTGANAPVVLPFTAPEGFPVGSTSGTFDHTFTLSSDLTGISVADFLAGLEGGQAYANIHNAIFPGGEIRGQLQQVPEPSAFLFIAAILGVLGVVVIKRRQTD